MVATSDATSTERDLGSFSVKIELLPVVGAEDVVLDTMKLRLPSLPRLDRPLLCAVMARVSDKVLGKSWSVAGLLRAESV